MKTVRICLSAIMLIAGAIVLTFLVVNTQDVKNSIGNFLLSSYSFMGYTVPLFFFWLFYIIMRKDSVLRSVTWPLFALIPFFFFSLSFRTFLWSAGTTLPPFWAVTQLFGQSGAGVFWVVLGTSTVLALSLLYYISSARAIVQQTIVQQNNNQETQSSVRQNSLQYNESITPYARYQKNPILTQKITAQQYSPTTVSSQSMYHPVEHFHHHESTHDTALKKEATAVTSTNEGVYKKEVSHIDASQERDNEQKDMHLQYASYPTGLETERNEEISLSRNDSRYILFFHKDTSVRKQLYYTEYERELLQDRIPIGVEGFTNVPKDSSMQEKRHTITTTSEPRNSIASNSNRLVSKHEVDADNSNAQEGARGESGTAVLDRVSHENEVFSNDEVDIFDIHTTDTLIETNNNNDENAFLQLDDNDEMLAYQKEFETEELEDALDDNVFDGYFDESISDADDSRMQQDKQVPVSVIEDSHQKQYVHEYEGVHTKESIHKELDEIVEKKLKMQQQDNADVSKEQSESSSLQKNNTMVNAQKSMEDAHISHIQSEESNKTGDNDTFADISVDTINKGEIPTSEDFSRKIGAILKKEHIADAGESDSNASIDMKKKITKTASSSSQLKKRKKKYFIPISGVLNPPIQVSSLDTSALQEISQRLEVTLQEFSIQAKVVSVCRGPVVTLFEIVPASGVRVRRIVELSDNIALRLAAPSIRIVAPIPGKEAVGIEVPNKNSDIVSFSELISQSEFHNKNFVLPIALGKSILAKTVVVDLAKTPHMLIAGATGSGKSVCVNSIICSLLYSCEPENVKLILIDPKIVELSFYNDIPHLLTPVISDPVKSVKVLHWCVEEMERRYAMLEQYNVREIESYNKKIYMHNPNAQKMSYIVIIIDEFADLMMTSGKEIETLVSRITAKSRAIGIHLVIATQRPSTDVITGLIKSNVPTRISFMVASKIDSRIILDVNGAEKLLGKGDMLYSSAQHPFPDRLQGAYLEEGEVERVVEQVKQVGGSPQYMDESLFEQDKQEGEGIGGVDDLLWDHAVEEVIQSRRASASHLQRRFKIGYNRAARLIDDMEYKGIIGPQQGGKQREVLIA